MNRREALKSLAAMVGGGAAASVLPKSTKEEPFLYVLSFPEDAILSEAEVAKIHAEWDAMHGPGGLIILPPGAKLTALPVVTGIEFDPETCRLTVSKSGPGSG